MIKIKTATQNDAEIIAAISSKTFYDAFATKNTEADMEKHLKDFYSTTKMEEELADEKNIFFLAYENEKLVGYAKMVDADKEEAKELKKPIEIERIYAVKGSMGRGIGKALMQKCIETAIQKKRETIWLGVWEQNLSAINFYTKGGFIKFGTHIFIVGDDPQTDWLMKKQL
ncbi:MAG: GNAT family N-acetyltransferase [Ferruginibacter sp.]